MKYVLRSFLLSLLLAPLFTIASAQSAVITYTNRTAFEAALSSVQIDSLDGITPYSHTTDIRADYTISANMYGCINHDGCGDNSVIGFDNAYQWIYSGSPGTFTFDSPTMGIGLDYANPDCCNYGAIPSLDGNSSGATSGFFGIIYDTAQTSFLLTQSSSYLLFDNVTYGQSQAEVPEPASMMLFGLGIVGLAGLRHHRKTA